jgi:hypothetical protein
VQDSTFSLHHSNQLKEEMQDHSRILELAIFKQDKIRIFTKVSSQGNRDPPKAVL